ncbi:MAG TPA: hypothetical protein DDX93_05200 [Smithella sp.]|nr:hypothetical protein [Smithella sp.]
MPDYILIKCYGLIVKDSEERRTIRRKGKFPVVLENGKGITRDFSSAGFFSKRISPLLPARP